jgi:uncharacterized protein (TIGR02444 family)
MTEVPQSTAPNPFWDFSLDFYARPSVSAACLTLQDECGADINLLLFLLWRAAAGRLLSQDEVTRLDGEVRDWRDAAIAPLRALCRRLKETALIEPAPQQKFRDQVKSLELEAERLQQDALYAASRSRTLGTEAPPQHAARGSIAGYERVLGRTFPSGAAGVLVDAFDAAMKDAGRAG